MTYTARVKTCQPSTAQGALQLCTQVEILSGDRVVGEFKADIDHARHPTEADVRAELRRLADAEVQRLTDADAIAKSLQGASL